jgi:hypothetical protein
MKKKFYALGRERGLIASTAWLPWFRRLHGVWEVAVQGGRLSGDEFDASEFWVGFRNLIKQNVYSADEMALLWKCFPKKVLAFESEHCASATTTHKIKLLCS